MCILEARFQGELQREERCCRRQQQSLRSSEDCLLRLPVERTLAGLVGAGDLERSRHMHFPNLKRGLIR